MSTPAGAGDNEEKWVMEMRRASRCHRSMGPTATGAEDERVIEPVPKIFKVEATCAADQKRCRRLRKKLRMDFFHPLVVIKLEGGEAIFRPNQWSQIFESHHH
jgi:hypothetical protein